MVNGPNFFSDKIIFSDPKFFWDRIFFSDPKFLFRPNIFFLRQMGIITETRYQVIPQQVFQDFEPPTSTVSTLSAQAPPLIYWHNTWTESELLDDFYDTFQMIKICFSIIIRNIFWDFGAVFKNIKPWFRKKFISLLII